MIGNRYRIEREIGAGGIGVVYEAFDTVLKKTVAVKQLRGLSESEFIRFQNEARAAGQLNHPTVIEVMDFGITSETDPQLFMVMEFVAGSTLKDIVKEQGPLHPDRAVSLLTQICEGLSHAHGKGILHRDIKPSNIMVFEGDDGERVKIVDFGLAKAISNEQALTAEGVGPGTPLYMSPEQLDSRELDESSDVYSFGCLMFEVLAGVPPFTGDNLMEIVANKLKSKPPVVSSVSGHENLQPFDSIVAKCLERSKEERFKSFQEVLEQFRLLDTDSSIIGEKEENEPSRRVLRRKASISIAVIAGIAAALLIYGGYLANQGTGASDSPALQEGAPPHDDDKEYKKKVVALAMGAKAGREIIELGPHEVEANQIIDSDLERLSKERPDITFLKLDECSLTAAGYKHLTYLPLETLRIDLRVISEDETTTKLLEQHLIWISKIKTLKTFTLEDAYSTPGEYFKHLANLPNLSTMELEECRITDAALSSIASITALKRLKISDSRDFTWKGLKRLADSSNLKELQCDHSVLDDSMLSEISRLPLYSLNLEKCGKLTSKGIQKLERIKTLRDLTIDAPVSAAANLTGFYRSISRLKKLERLAIVRASPARFELLDLPELSLLRLRSMTLKADDVEELKAMQSLSELEFVECTLKTGCAERIARLPIKTLVLTSSSVEPGLLSLVKLRSSRSLQTLRLNALPKRNKTGLQLLKTTLSDIDVLVE